jgi:NADH:ubiquinone oxidoreductase subunit 3 (subunit A)
MLSDWLYIGIFLTLSAFLPFAAITIAGILGPKKPNKIKQSTYECGIETVGETWVQYKASYYVYALIFVLFDVEAVFLFPWAVSYNKIGLWGVLEAVLFIIILFGALIYAWRKGALEWQ